MADDNEMKNGTLDVEQIDFQAMGVPPEKVEEAKSRMLSFVNDYKMELAKHIAPRGTFNLPPLLEERRLQWEIPDGVFRVAAGCLYDRILIWQIPLLAEKPSDNDKFGGVGGILWKSDQTKEKETREAPRGVIVGAGLKALDSLRSHGVDLGHIVYFCKNTVYSIKVDQVAGHEQRVSLAREGDLVLSEDTALEIRTGAAKVVTVVEEKDGMVRTTHMLADGNGIARERMLPPATEEI